MHRLGALLLLAGLAAAPACLRAATPRQIDDAIRRAKTYLYAQQSNGNWENKSRNPADRGNEHNGGQWGGRTALATYALLAAGESPQDPRLQPAIEFLRTEALAGTYALGLRMQVWYFLPPTAETRALAAKDARALMNMINGPAVKAKGALGHYGYVADTASYSHSRSQYAVLGIWAAVMPGVTGWRSMSGCW